jgi:hypothetical protein
VNDGRQRFGSICNDSEYEPLNYAHNFNTTVSCGAAKVGNNPFRITITALEAIIVEQFEQIFCAKTSTVLYPTFYCTIRAQYTWKP